MIRGHICESCNKDVWLNQPIPLQLHHIDGNSQNNDYSNLKILCANCHALTPNYCGRNIKKNTNVRYDDKHICSLIPLSHSVRQVIMTLGMSTSKANYDRIRSLMQEHNLSLKSRSLTEAEMMHAFNNRKIVRPSKSELTNMVWSQSRLSLSKELNVSDKAIQKWCDFYDIATPPRGYWSKTHEEQMQIKCQIFGANGETRTLTRLATD